MGARWHAPRRPPELAHPTAARLPPSISPPPPLHLPSTPQSLAFYVAINVFRTEYRRPDLEGADAPQQVLQSAWRLTHTHSFP